MSSEDKTTRIRRYDSNRYDPIASAVLKDLSKEEDLFCLEMRDALSKFSIELNTRPARNHKDTDKKHPTCSHDKHSTGSISISNNNDKPAPARRFRRRRASRKLSSSPTSLTAS